MASKLNILARGYQTLLPYFFKVGMPIFQFNFLFDFLIALIILNKTTLYENMVFVGFT